MPRGSSKLNFMAFLLGSMGFGATQLKCDPLASCSLCNEVTLSSKSRMARPTNPARSLTCQKLRVWGERTRSIHIKKVSTGTRNS